MKVTDYEIINSILPPNINSYHNKSKRLRYNNNLILLPHGKIIIMKSNEL